MVSWPFESMNKKDVMGCLGGAGFLFLCSAYFPLFGPLFCLLTPAPFLYYSTKLGLKNGIKLAFLTIVLAGIAGILIGYPQAILFCVELSALGLVLAEIFRRRFTLGQTILFASLFLILMSMGHLFILGLSKGVDPFELLVNYLNGQVKQTITAYEEMGVPGEDLVELESYARVFVNTVYPSLMIVGTGFTVWLNVVVARPLFTRGNLKYPDFVPMDRWETPEPLIWGVIVSGFSLFLLPGVIRSLAANVMIVLMAIYLFHGVSIIAFFLHKYRLPLWIRIGIYLLIIIQQLFLVLLALAGVFDQWVDFRKLHREQEAS
ncbi:conserved membrane hypothetical protein [uncultured Desulfobacterium sp.]|uniref:Membrane protein (DUF2232) n=1 Tax=uncultured Desulfobacterium sp. TaxID=201089 RepID=A0A445N2M6_9BACT|nr:conserved membrane hypothetical protein [uncultured Desulfobacterium sp.]